VTSDLERRSRFEAIAEEVFEPLQRYLRRRTDPDRAQDALSDVMLVVWRRLDDVPHDAALPWTYGIASRVLANQRRTESRHLKLVDRLQSEPRVSEVPDPAETGSDPDLEAAIARLNEEEREYVRLWAWEGLEPREIATVKGVTANAATLRLSRARSKLAKYLERQDRLHAGQEPVEGTQENR